MNKIRSILSNTYYGQMSFLQKNRSTMSYEEQQEIMYRDYVSNIVETGFINSIMQNKNSNEEISLYDTKDIKSFDLKKEVINWVEILENYSDLGTIKDNSGEMLIKNDKSLDKIKEKISITKINSDEREYFIDVVGDER